MSLDSKRRFTDRVADYVKFRPSYPAGVIETLVARCGLCDASVVADIGSGTGILTALLLDTGCTVIAVEPNAAMRSAAEAWLGSCSTFRSVDGSAEATGLDDASVDIVTAGQAFHWFDRDAARAEFARILKPGGWVALIWNVRDTGASAFMSEYESALRTYGTDYASVTHEGVTDADLVAFFGDEDRYALAEYRNAQLLDHDGLVGRIGSASYAPPSGHPNYAPMMAALDASFAAHEVDGFVRMEYATRVYYGRLG